MGPQLQDRAAENPPPCRGQGLGCAPAPSDPTSVRGLPRGPSLAAGSLLAIIRSSKCRIWNILHTVSVSISGAACVADPWSWGPFSRGSSASMSSQPLSDRPLLGLVCSLQPGGRGVCCFWKPRVFPSPRFCSVLEPALLLALPSGVPLLLRTQPRGAAVLPHSCRVSTLGCV